jgi:hypothetical protein
MVARFTWTAPSPEQDTQGESETSMKRLLRHPRDRPSVRHVLSMIAITSLFLLLLTRFISDLDRPFCTLEDPAGLFAFQVASVK